MIIFFSFPVSAVDKRGIKDNRKVHPEKVKGGETSGNSAVDLPANRTLSEKGKAEQLFEGY